MNLCEDKKIELAYDVLQVLNKRSISIKDRIEVIEIAHKSLLAKKRLYDRRIK